MEFFRIEYWSGLPFRSPGDLPNPGTKLRSLALQVDSLPAEPHGKPKNTGVGSLSLLQGIFLNQELNWGLLHFRQVLYQLSYQGKYRSFLLQCYLENFTEFVQLEFTNKGKKVYVNITNIISSTNLLNKKKMQYANAIKTNWKNSNFRTIGNLHKVEVSNYRAFCLENENQSHRFIQMCDHIKRCKLEFLNKIRFSEGQLYLIAPIFDQKKKKIKCSTYFGIIFLPLK